MSESVTVVTLSAQNLESRLETRDGVVVLAIGDDGVTEVEISDEVGSRARAARALDQLAATASARAAMLRAEGESEPARGQRRNGGET